MILANPSGAAFQGNVQIGDGDSGLDGVQMGAADEIGAGEVITMDGSSAARATLQLMGYNQTVAGICDSTGAGIVENTQNTAGIGPAALTIDNTANISYDGYIRDSYSGSGTLSVVKLGSGTLSFSGSNITYSGGTTIDAGTLQAESSSAFGASTGSLTMGGGQLDLDGNSVTVGTLSGTGGTITNSAASGTSTLTVNQSGNSSYGGVIADGVTPWR